MTEARLELRNGAVTVGVLLMSFLVAVGCGEKYEQVDYDPPLVGPFRELVFASASLGATDLQLERFANPVRVEEQLVVTGHVAADKPEIPFGSLRMTTQHGSKTVMCRSAAVTLTAVPDGEGFNFRSEVKAPKRAGKYQVEVRARDALLALGEITVQSEP